MLHTCRGRPLCLPVLCGGIRWWCGRWIHYCLVGVWFTVKGFMIHIVLCSWESGEGGFGILTGQFWTRKRRCRCFSNALQSYEKILKLTNYKQKFLEKFCIGAVCCYVSSSYRACLLKHCVQGGFVVFWRWSNRPHLVQMADGSYFGEGVWYAIRADFGKKL